MSAPLTFLIKTFNRPECVTRLLDSALRFWPDIPIVVADDGNMPWTHNHPKLNHLKLPFDVGLKAGRCAALQVVESDAFILMDDDFIISERTDCALFVKLLRQHGLLVLGGDVLDSGTWSTNYRLNLAQNGRRLLFQQIPLDRNASEVIPCNMVANFYVADTQRFRDAGAWNPKLKIGGHEELFWRFKQRGAKVAWTNRVGITHQPNRHDDPEYLKFRNDRVWDFWPPIAASEYGITSCDDWRLPTHKIKAGYCARANPKVWDDSGMKDEYQAEEYRISARLFRELGLLSVLDVGCGSAFKLRREFAGASVFGAEVGAMLGWLRATYPDGFWCDAENDKLPTVDMVLSVDAVEHIWNPTHLMKRIAETNAKRIVIATVDRDAVRGLKDNGPPNNPHHCREWNKAEFAMFISQWFTVLEHTTTGRGGQVVVCKLK